MKTNNYKTRNILIERKNISINKYFGIAMDIGYSSVKGFSPNKIFCFPSYATKITKQIMNVNKASEDDILYRDDTTKEVWRVGNLAIKGITSESTNDSSLSLFGRNRYFAPMFKVLARTGIGMGMLKNIYGNTEDKEVFLQTGLPSAYKKTDESLLKEALSGHHLFSLKVGDRDWKSFDLELPEDHIDVIEQPLGTLLSVSINNDGRQTLDAIKYFKSNLIVFDPGFGTLDTFVIKNGLVDSYETDDRLGMKRIMEETVKEIFDEFHQEISITAIQNYLETGQVKIFDRRNMTVKYHDFSEILQRSSEKVRDEAIEKIKTTYNNLFDYDYLIVTGGTGAAWYEYIKDYFKGMESLIIIPGGQNDNLPFIFSNVRGYYMYQLNHLRKLK